MTAPHPNRLHVVVAIPQDVRGRLFTEETWNRLSRTADVTVNPDGGSLSGKGAAALLPTTDVLVTGWGTHADSRDWIDAAARLKAFIHTAGTVRPLLDDRIFARGVLVSSQAESNGRPVAEYTVSMILLGVKSVFRVEREFRADRSAYPLDAFTGGAFGAAVGIVSASRIGRRVVEMLSAYDLDVLIHDPFLTDDEAQTIGAHLVGLDELFERSQVVSLHTPLLPTTRGMIGRRHLQRMPDGATFINTARGALVDQEALIDELMTNRIDAVLDVTEPEVLPLDSPLWDLPNVVLTPHMAGSVGNEIPRLGAGAVDEVLRVAEGQRPRHLITESSFIVSA